MRLPASLPAARLSVATKLLCTSPCSAESNTTTGIFDRLASLTTFRSALSLSGASTIPLTPWAVNCWTRSICCFRSSSLSGPFQMTSTSSSLDAFTAPACTAFQNSWVVPLGMTAIFSLAPPALPDPSAAEPPPAWSSQPKTSAAMANISHANPNIRRSTAGRFMVRTGLTRPLWSRKGVVAPRLRHRCNLSPSAVFVPNCPAAAYSLGHAR